MKNKKMHQVQKIAKSMGIAWSDFWFKVVICFLSMFIEWLKCLDFVFDNLLH